MVFPGFGESFAKQIQNRRRFWWVNRRWIAFCGTLGAAIGISVVASLSREAKNWLVDRFDDLLYQRRRRR